MREGTHVYGHLIDIYQDISNIKICLSNVRNVFYIKSGDKKKRPYM